MLFQEPSGQHRSGRQRKVLARGWMPENPSPLRRQGEYFSLTSPFIEPFANFAKSRPPGMVLAVWRFRVREDVCSRRQRGAREESLLLVAKGFDWVEAGGFHGGPDAED